MATLHPRMFIPQRTLEAWLDSGSAEVDHEVVLLKNAGRAYDLVPAVRFLKVVPTTSAPELLGKVLSEARILELGGEIMGTSVLFGEAAFEVEAGYIGQLRGA